MDLAALIVSIAAAVGRGQKMAAARAAEDAERSADAAQEAVGYQRDEVERNRVRFSIRHISKSQYAITHDGTDAAYGVRVDLGDLYVQNGGETEFDRWEPGHAERYVIAKTMGTETTHIKVTWHMRADQGDDPLSTQLLV